MKIGSLNRKASLVLLACAFLQVSSFASDVKDVVESAKGSYYSLKDHGLKSFNCEVAPDWRKFLESVDKKPFLQTMQDLRNLRDCALPLQLMSRATPLSLLLWPMAAPFRPV